MNYTQEAWEEEQMENLGCESVSDLIELLRLKQQENRYLKWRLSRAEHSISSMVAGVTAIVQDSVAHATRVQKMGGMAGNNDPSGNAPNDRFARRVGFSTINPMPPEGYDGPFPPPSWVTPDGKRFYSSWDACATHCPEYTNIIVHEDEQGDEEE